jgi:hypothetical protein
MDEKTIARFWSKVDKSGPVPAHCPELGRCWIWTAGVRGDGYGNYWIGNAVQIGAHRFSYSIAFSDPGEFCVLHKCDRPTCVNPLHLYIGTHLDNAHDRKIRNRDPNPITKRDSQLLVAARGNRNGSRLHPERLKRGPDHPRFGRGRVSVKLNESMAIAIRTSLLSTRAIAANYGVCVETISNVRQRRTWKHI